MYPKELGHAEKISAGEDVLALMISRDWAKEMESGGTSVSFSSPRPCADNKADPIQEIGRHPLRPITQIPQQQKLTRRTTALHPIGEALILKSWGKF